MTINDSNIWISHLDCKMATSFWWSDNEQTWTYILQAYIYQLLYLMKDGQLIILLENW